MGRQFNGYELHRALLKVGHRSRMAVMHGQLDDESVHEVGNRVSRWLDVHVLPLVERELSVHGLLSLSGWSLLLSDVMREADLVHLHLVHAVPFFSLALVPLIARERPVLWSLHDPWLLSGHCVHPLDCTRWKTGCGRCPDLDLPFKIRFDTTAVQWSIREALLRRSQIGLVVASRWMSERVAASPLVRHLPCNVIPYGIDTTVFRRRDKAHCRRLLGVPPDVRVIAFRYRGAADRFKGWPWLRTALTAMSDGERVHLLVFEGSLGDPQIYGEYGVTEVGWLDDPEEVATALAAADVFVMPSVAEAFGLMAVEAMACGTPVVGFAGTALEEVLRSPMGGLCVPQGDAAGLLEAIEVVLTEGAVRDRLVSDGAALVEELYNKDRYVTEHLRLYEALLAGDVSDG